MGARETEKKPDWCSQNAPGGQVGPSKGPYEMSVAKDWNWHEMSSRCSVQEQVKLSLRGLLQVAVDSHMVM
eukprot:754545-Hanusia_phi.AAC.3